MIRKFALVTMVFVLAISVSLVSAQGIHEPGTGLTNPDVKAVAQGTGQGLQAANETNVSASTPGIHEPGTGITNPEMKQAAQETRQGYEAQSGQPVKEPAASAQKSQPGFDVVLALMGFLAVAFIIIGGKN